MEECPRCHYFSVYYSVEKGKKRCFMPNCLWEEGQPADGPVGAFVPRVLLFFRALRDHREKGTPLSPQHKKMLRDLRRELDAVL
ncbi:MAG: hypothetical protein DRP63_02510 [Planctomycetota bacterium]|nr:MAG: hypothetical protein DRP63_02510 [Planctomycetota bacterium]